MDNIVKFFEEEYSMDQKEFKIEIKDIFGSTTNSLFYYKNNTIT